MTAYKVEMQMYREKPPPPPSSCLKGPVKAWYLIAKSQVRSCPADSHREVIHVLMQDPPT